MGFLQEMREKREANAKKKAEANSQKFDEYLATLGNSNSNMDEFARAIRWLFLPAFSSWVFYIGYLYTRQQLDTVVTPTTGLVLALTIPFIVQIIKVYSGKKVLRAINFKWYDNSKSEFLFWSGVGILTVLMFGWSLKISIWDVQGTASDNYKANHQVTLTAAIGNATAGIDAQIAEITKNNQSASTMKTKKGRIAWSGQSVLMANSTTLSSLNAQRESIVKQTIEDYKEANATGAATAETRGNFFARFGGFGEAGEIIFLLLLAWAEKVNRDNHLSHSGGQAIPQHQNNTQPAPSIRYNGVANEYRQIGFRYGQNTVSQPAETVTQPIVTVTQQNDTVEMASIGADAVLLNCKKAVESDLPNLNRSDANPATVSARINAAMESAYALMLRDDFVPTHATGAKFYAFLVEKALPALDEKGWPYPRGKFMCQRLLAIIPKAVLS